MPLNTEASLIVLLVVAAICRGSQTSRQFPISAKVNFGPQRANASDRYRRCRRDILCLRLLVSHRRCRREFLILRLIVFSLTSRGLQYPAAASCSLRPRYYLSSCSWCSPKLESSMLMWQASFVDEEDSPKINNSNGGFMG